jgi:hypothetical protein
MARSGLSFFLSFVFLQNRSWLFLLCAIAICSPTARSGAQESTHSSGWVVIPIDEYRDLHARAYPAEHEPELPSVDATLTRVDYDLRSNGEIATGRADLTVDVLKDGWVRIPIPPGLLVREAQLDGKPLALAAGGGGKGGGQVSALLSHPGRAVLVLSIALPVTATAGEESISLPPTQSGMTRASLQLSRPDVDVKVGGGLLTEKSEVGRESKWMAYGRGTEPLTFSWRRKTEDHHSSLPLRMRGSLTELVSLGEDSTAMVAETEVQVTQGEARAVKIHLPANININQVSGAAVADWEMQAGDLVISFLEPVAQSTRFVVSGETRLARDGQVEIPLFRLLDAERETGGVAVEVLGAGEIKDPKSQGLEDADATDLGEMVTSRQSPSLAAFRFRSGDPATRALTLNIVRYTQQAVLLANVEEARYRILLSNDGKSLAQARYAVRNNQRNFVKITLPAGATVWSAALSGKPVKPGQAPDGSLLVPLQKARGGEEAPEFVVEIAYFTRGVKWEDKGNFAVTLPALDLPVSRTGLLVYYPPLFKVSAEPGIFRTETYENPSSAAFSINAEVGTGSGIGGPVAGTLSVNGLSAESDQATRQRKDEDTRALADKFFAKSQGARAKGVLPIKVSFPAFGPSLFLVAELTSASQVPTSSLSYQRGKKGGAR